MEALGELLASDHKLTFEFFYKGLEEFADPTVDRQELLYNASLLAHFAQVSTHAVGDVPTPSSLAKVFDGFVLDASHSADGEMMEVAGAQCLLLAGFFEDQMRRKYPIRWYAELGAGFYHRASVRQQSARKAALLTAIARRFEIWRQLQAQLSRSLRDLPYLMAPPPPPALP